MNKHQKAIVTYLLLFGAIAPASAQDALNQAQRAIEARDYRMAVVYYQRALQDSPNNKAILTSLASSYELRGRFDKARETAFELIQLEGSNTTALLILARDEARSERWQHAASYSKRALEIDSSNRPARAILGNALANLGDLDAASQVANEPDEQQRKREAARKNKKQDKP